MEENKMGTMRIDKLLVNLSLPLMASKLVQALYNVVDSIFVSRISEEALSAVSMAFPIQMLIMAFGNGVGVGMNALLSKTLGEKNFKKAGDVAKNGVFLTAINAVIFLLVGIFLVKPFFLSQVGTTDSEIYIGGVSYLRIVCMFSFGIFTQVIFERMLQSTGRTVYSMIAQAAGAVFNIIFDPLLIFGLCGFPKLGIAGAAWATVFGQMLAAILAITFNLKANKEINLNPKGFRPDGQIIRKIYTVGVPTAVMQAIGSLMSYCMNRILVGFTSTANAVFGVYFKLQSFVFMPIFGLNNGVVSIIAYNYGAGKRRRIMKTLKLSIIIAEAIMLVGFAIFQLFAKQMLGFFKASDTMLEIGIPALRIIAVSFPLVGVGIMSGGVFQGLGNGVYSMIVSLARQLIVLIPAAFILAKVGGLSAVWWSFPIAEAVSLAVSTLLLIKIYRDVIKKIPDNA